MTRKTLATIGTVAALLSITATVAHADQGRRGAGPYCIALTDANARKQGATLPLTVVAGTIRSVGAHTPCWNYEKRTFGLPLKPLASSATVVAICYDTATGQTGTCPTGFGVGPVGPQGATGPAGPQGPAGEPGTAGSSGGTGAGCTVSKIPADKGHVLVTLTCGATSVTFREDVSS